MSKITDWVDAGAWPLQDHDPDTIVSMRQMMAGVRVGMLPDPETGGDGMVTIGAEDDKGTLGDVHPWFFWQTNDREERGMGSFSMAFAGITAGRYEDPQKGPITGPNPKNVNPSDPMSVVPVRSGRFSADGRYKLKYPGWPKCWPALPAGTAVIVMPGTEETAQHEVMFHADPRLFSVNVSEPAEVGTLVVDLQPDDQPCMGEKPGIGGRSARLQSFCRVIPLGQNGLQAFGAGPGNMIAWNHSLSQQDKLPGWGATYSRLAGQAGPKTGGPSKLGPITQAPGSSIHRIQQGLPGGGPGAPRASAFGSGGVKSLAEGDGKTPKPEETGPGVSTDHDGDTPCDFGAFRPDAEGGHGIGLTAHIGGFGPLHAGARGDKHEIGKDEDGNPINSSHIAAGAYFWKDSNKDGPLEFQDKLYPHPPEMKLITRTHLVWDPGMPHKWLKGNKPGTWRWYSETNVCIPGSVPPISGGNPPIIGPPTGPRGPTPSAPGPNGPGPNPGIPGPPGGGPVYGPPLPGPKTPGPGAGTPNPGSGPTTPRPQWPGYGPGKFGRWPGEPGYEPTQGSGSSSSAPPPPPVPGAGDFPNDGGLPGGVILPPIGKRIQSTSMAHVGDTTPGDVALTQLHHPHSESFVDLAFRPQMMLAGEPSFVHNTHASATEIYDDESYRPQVIVMRAWGGHTGSGEWDYTSLPETSRARGGTASGGVLLTPPEFELEDYFGIGSTADVEAPITTSWFTAAPGVGLALGSPSTGGGLASKAVTIAQTLSGNNPLVISQLNSSGVAVEMIEAEVDQSTGEATVTLAGGTSGGGTLIIPTGTTAQRPTGGGIRMNTNLIASVATPEYYDATEATWKTFLQAGLPTGTTGIDADFNFYDNVGADHHVVIDSGIITGWTVTP